MNHAVDCAKARSQGGKQGLDRGHIRNIHRLIGGRGSGGGQGFQEFLNRCIQRPPSQQHQPQPRDLGGPPLGQGRSNPPCTTRNHVNPAGSEGQGRWGCRRGGGWDGNQVASIETARSQRQLTTLGSRRQINHQSCQQGGRLAISQPRLIHIHMAHLPMGRLRRQTVQQAHDRRRIRLRGFGGFHRRRPRCDHP